MSGPKPLDIFRIDRFLNPPHREDDEPCSCDECMSYGAEDNGFDWYRIPPANRIAMRILDGADGRFAELRQAFRDHDSTAGLLPSYITAQVLDQWEASAIADEERHTTWSINPTTLRAILPTLRAALPPWHDNVNGPDMVRHVGVPRPYVPPSDGRTSHQPGPPEATS